MMEGPYCVEDMLLNMKKLVSSMEISSKDFIQMHIWWSK